MSRIPEISCCHQQECPAFENHAGWGSQYFERPGQKSKAGQSPSLGLPCSAHVFAISSQISSLVEATLQTPFDGGGFPVFRSYHDYRMPSKIVGPMHSDHIQFRHAFADFKRELLTDRNWARKFTPQQVRAIQEAISTNGPKIQGFTWHHHQDDVLQLVEECVHHATHHYGGRFTSGGRP